MCKCIFRWIQLRKVICTLSSVRYRWHNIALWVPFLKWYWAIMWNIVPCGNQSHWGPRQQEVMCHIFEDWGTKKVHLLHGHLLLTAQRIKNALQSTWLAYCSFRINATETTWQVLSLFFFLTEDLSNLSYCHEECSSQFGSTMYPIERSLNTLKYDSYFFAAQDSYSSIEQWKMNGHFKALKVLMKTFMK